VGLAIYNLEVFVMKKYLGLTLAFLFSLGLASQAGAEPQFGRDRGRREEGRVCLFKDIQFQGVQQCFNAGDSVSTLPGGLNGEVSSIRIYGRATVTVYDERNFRGHSAVFTSTMPDLGQVRLQSKSWSDRIQSIQISTDQAYGGSRDVRPYETYPNGTYPNQTYPNQSVQDGICVYDRPNYQGRQQCWNAGQEVSDLGRAGRWSDRIESIRFFGPTAVVAYRDIGFGGSSVVIRQDVPDLAQLSGPGYRNWDRQISSIRIEEERGSPRRLGRRRY
jgi:Peptidase inhibitor family I36